MAKVEKLKSTIVLGILLTISLLSIIFTYCINIPLTIEEIQASSDGTVGGNLGAGIGAAIVVIVLFIVIVLLSLFSLVVSIIALPFSIKNISRATNKVIKGLSIGYVVSCGVIIFALITRIVLFALQVY